MTLKFVKNVMNMKQRKDLYKDIPIAEAVRRAEMWVRQGFLVFFKFTCENCGSRQTFPEPNRLYLKGRCERCGHVTKIEKCGFMTMAAIGLK